jgi:hypothetical protein
MHTLNLQDLSASIELDRKARSALRGGVGDAAAGASQSNVQSMVVAANVGNASGFAGPANIQSDNTFTQDASNYNFATNLDAFLVLGRLGLVRVH